MNNGLKVTPTFCKFLFCLCVILLFLIGGKCHEVAVYDILTTSRPYLFKNTICIDCYWTLN